MKDKETEPDLHQKYQEWIEANTQLQQITQDLNSIFTQPSERLSLVLLYRDWAVVVERLTSELDELKAWPLLTEEPF